MKIILGKKEQANMEVRMREEKGKREKRKEKKKRGRLAEDPGARVYHMGRTNEGKTKWLR